MVCVRTESQSSFVGPQMPEHFKYYVVELTDAASDNIVCHLLGVNSFIASALQAGGKVAVHDLTGLLLR